MGRLPSTTPTLSARSLTRVYGEVRALDGVDLDLFGGEVVALLGVNGAGKTTLMRILCGLDAPSTKKGVLRTSSSASLREVVGYCPQELTIWGDLTAKEQVAMLGRLHGASARDASARADHLLSTLGLAERAGALASTFSGGMKRRLSIAMALVHDPEVLILDEAEVGLDPQSRVNLRAFITRLARQEGKAILLSTHGIDEVERIADRVVILDKGKVVASGAPDELVEVFGGHVTITLDLSGEVLSSANGKALLDALEASFARELDVSEEGRVLISHEGGADALEQVAAMAREHGVRWQHLGASRPGLEEIFLSHTTDEKRGAYESR